MNPHATRAADHPYLSQFDWLLIDLHHAQVDGDTDRERALTAESEAYL